MPGSIKLSHPPTRGFWELPVLYEDEHLLAVDKPAGLDAGPEAADLSRPNLVRLLHDAIKRGVPWAVERGVGFLAGAHRLDVDTGGVLLLARSKETLLRLADQFGSQKPVLTYAGIVTGVPPEDVFELDAAISPHPVQPGLVRIDRMAGKKATTRFEVRERFRGFTRISCTPLTHRTHQIRIHLRHLKLPLVGDELYGGDALLLSGLKHNYHAKRGAVERPLFSHAAIHLESLDLTHPVTAAPLQIVSPLPHDFQVALKHLRRYAAATAG